MTTETDQTALESALEPTEQTLAEAFTDEAKFLAMFQKVESAARAVPVNLKTMSGRQAVASVAYKIGQLKTRVDKRRLAATESLRKETARINGIGNTYKERLQTLQDATRAPLDDWEAADRERQGRVDGFFRVMDTWSISMTSDTLAELDGRITALASKAIQPEVFLDRHPEAVAKRDDVLAFTVRCKDALVAKAEAERLAAEEQAAKDAELEELRREKAEREAAQAAEQAAKDAEAARAEQERLEAERIAQAALEAAEHARVRAEGEHQAALEAQAKAHQDELDRIAAEQRAEADRLEAARIAQEEAQRRQREADEARQRDADHRAAVLSEVAADLIDAHEGISEHLAMKIAHKIAASGVRHTSIQF